MAKAAQHRFPGILAASAVLLAAGSVPAQVPRFASQTDLVVLSATAVDGKGRPVTNLRREEFRIVEDGRPQKLEHFSLGNQTPLRVLFLIDASGSMNGQLKTTSTRMALIQLLAALGPDDLAALAAFDHRYWGVVKFTQDRKAIEAGFDELEPFSSTALHDALDQAAHDIAVHGEGRRAVVVITDGVDTSSQKNPEEVIARSRALDVPIYAVSVVSPLDDPASSRFAGSERQSASATQGAIVLGRYAALSGGAAFTVSDFAGLKAASDRIVGELKHQYRLGYDPPPGPSRFRRIAVSTTRKGVVVKTRSGYMPQPQS
ncbi:MAG TPA: VWA domain-containing protein [Vicinamibacteria bacterium]